MNLLERLLALHRKHRWLTHVLFWGALLLFQVFSSKYHDGKAGTYGFELISDFLYMVPEILSAYAVAYWVLPGLLYHRRYVSMAVALLGIIYLACVLGRIFIVKVDEPMAGGKRKDFETYWAIFTDLRKLLFVYFYDIISIIFLFLCLKTLKDQLLIQQRTMQLEKEKAETELKLLKAQLNPHFLFNTLNNIYSLSFTSQEKTSASIARLADILDHILYRTNHRFVPLSAEVALIRNYIELEKLRYDSRLRVELCIEGDREVEIAPLILLSLVENAFKHGASNDAGEPVIEMHLGVSADKLQFEISNTVAVGLTHAAGGGAGQTGGAAREAARAEERIGLSNLQRQLNHIYGEDHELIVRQEETRFVVCLTIHLKHERARYEKDKMLVGG